MNHWWKLAFAIGIAFCFANVNTIKILKGNNPGLCSKKNKGETFLVRDRENKYKLLICTNDNGVFAWRTLNGKSPPGEFFNPAYDCTDILNRDPKAKDGPYWINLGKKSSPRKVWCDMITDGGGFILIGRKNTSETWSVPSNNKPVTPFGEPHWSSDLGEMPIVDFRVQVATAEDFKTTKAHWFYRLRKSRKLKDLMIINKGGCDKHSPGIGDVEFVKNLISDTIVTRKFRCSKFGLAHHPRTKFGWHMMNSCLQKPCGYGFAYHPLIKQFKYQTDFSGAFSYSVSSRISGISYAATAFVGCDNGKCCSCYGPQNGKKEYCLKECKAQNNGTVHKNNVFTWFWVRSSLPKRSWNKCMEYKKREGGKTVWYKFIDGSEIPILGRCAKGKVRFYEGMLVVPNNKTAAKVPSVTGMMVYRTDNQKLYVQGGEKLELIAKQKEIIKILNKDIAELKTKVENINQSITNRMRSFNYQDIPSNILFGMPSFIDQLKQWLPPHRSLTLCYRASEDSWASKRFHGACDGKGATVTIIRVYSYIFGGYTDISWGGSSGTYRSSTKSFIFSLRNRYNLKPFKADVYRYSHNAIYTGPGYGPIFGGGNDIYIANNAGQSTSSSSNFGHTYRPPSGYNYQASNTRALLAGSYSFTPSEIEVFYFM